MLKEFNRGLDCVREITEQYRLFKPSVKYIPEHKRIYAVVADGPIVEEKIDNYLILLKRSHAEYGQGTYIGFTVHRDFLLENNLPRFGEISVWTIVQYLARLEKNDKNKRAAVREVIIPIMEDFYDYLYEVKIPIPKAL